MSDIKNIDQWCAADPVYLANFYRSLKSATRPSFEGLLIVRNQLRPVDIYTYLKARFGEPNGMMNALRSDDSDNWVHWEYVLFSGDNNIIIMGTSRDIHLAITRKMSDLDWRDLIVDLKNDFSKRSPEKGRVQKSLEKFAIFQNKYALLASTCADLHALIVDTSEPLLFSIPKTQKEIDEYKQDEEESKTAITLYQSCLHLRLLMPVMAEAYINMIILIFCRDEIRNDIIAYKDFVRSKLPDRLKLLKANCNNFDQEVNKKSRAYGRFMQIINKRNDQLHGNVDPVREMIEIVYFDGKRPLFNKPGINIIAAQKQMRDFYDREGVIADYEDLNHFLLDIRDCLHPGAVFFFDQVMSTRYPGYELRKRRVTRILPDSAVTGYPNGIRFDDDLQVEWPQRAVAP